MFCAKCGIENAEGAAFCKNCGHNLNSVVTPSVQETLAAKTPLSSHPVLNVVKKLASSPLFLVAVIAYSAQILFSIVNSAGTGAKVEMFLYQLLDRLGGNVPYEFYDIVDGISRIGDIPYVLGTIIGLIPSFLICAGLWMTFASAKSRMFDGMKTSGLTMIKVLTILQLIGSCIAVAAIELLLFVAVIGIAATEYAPGAAIAILVLLVLVVAASYTLQIVYFAKIIKSLNAAKNTILTGVPTAKASRFVAVWAFISAFGALFSLTSSFLSSAATITSLICFGILIYKYNSSMRMIPVPTPAPAEVSVQ